MATEKQLSIPKGLMGKASEQQRSKAPDFVSRYANNISVSISNWDMSLMFGRLQGNNVVDEVAEILLSKEMAKVLTIIMSTHLQAYEEKFGEIKIVNINQMIEEMAGVEGVEVVEMDEPPKEKKKK